MAQMTATPVGTQGFFVDGKWIEEGKAFTWVSERDGWRHLYVAARDGNSIRRVTTGEFDVVKVLHVDEKAGVVYFSASPENPIQLYLYRCRLHDSGSAVRLTPADQPGWHDYDVSPDGTMAVHTHSRFGQPPRTELIAFADHKTIRPLVVNDKLREAVSKLTPSAAEFFRSDAGAGGMLDGWLIKPAKFDDDTSRLHAANLQRELLVGSALSVWPVGHERQPHDFGHFFRLDPQYSPGGAVGADEP
jgi:dipeptidyl-peptidase-4